MGTARAVWFFVWSAAFFNSAFAGEGLFLPTREVAMLAGHGESALFQPSDVTVSGGEAFVMDGVNNRVVVFDTKGFFKRTFGARGPGGDSLDMPLGIASDRQGNIYVADSRNHRIQVFGRNGDWKQGIRLRPDSYGFPAEPSDLVVDESRSRLVIVDNESHRLLVYGLNGTFMKEWGTLGYNRGEFRYPFGIAMDRDGFFYVCEAINTRVQVLDREGGFDHMIGEWGVKKGQFYRPYGVAVDARGLVFVSDCFMGVVQVFRPNGELVGILADNNKKRFNFNVPANIAFDEDNKLYLVEMGAHRVRVFKLLF